MISNFDLTNVDDLVIAEYRDGGARARIYSLEEIWEISALVFAKVVTSGRFWVIGNLAVHKKYFTRAVVEGTEQDCSTPKKLIFLPTQNKDDESQTGCRVG
jgi:hypothetical protein